MILNLERLLCISDNRLYEEAVVRLRLTERVQATQRSRSTRIDPTVFTFQNVMLKWAFDIHLLGDRKF